MPSIKKKFLAEMSSLGIQKSYKIVGIFSIPFFMAKIGLVSL